MGDHKEVLASPRALAENANLTISSLYSSAQEKATTKATVWEEKIDFLVS